MDLIASQRGVATLRDAHPGKNVVEDVVLLQRTQPALVRPDATQVATVDLIASQGGVATPRDADPSKSVIEDVVLLQRPLAVLIHRYATLLAVVDPIAAQRGICTLLDRHPGQGIAENVIVLQEAEAAIVDEHPGGSPVVNAVAPQARVGAAVNRHAGQAVAGDVAILQLEPALGDVHAVPLSTPHLPQRQIAHPADGGLEQDHVFAGGLNHHAAGLALSGDVQGFVDEKPFPVQPRPDPNAIPRPGSPDGLANGGVVALACSVHYVRSRRPPQRLHPPPRLPRVGCLLLRSQAEEVPVGLPRLFPPPQLIQRYRPAQPRTRQPGVEREGPLVVAQRFFQPAAPAEGIALVAPTDGVVRGDAFVAVQRLAEAAEADEDVGLDAPSQRESGIDAQRQLDQGEVAEDLRFAGQRWGTSAVDGQRSFVAGKSLPAAAQFAQGLAQGVAGIQMPGVNLQGSFKTGNCLPRAAGGSGGHAFPVPVVGSPSSKARRQPASGAPH